jgi:hypothetical protein
MSNVKSTVSALGRARIAREVGVTVAAVGNAIAEGRFPASWYGVVSKLCADASIECPLTIFAMKGITETESAA